MRSRYGPCQAQPGIYARRSSQGERAVRLREEVERQDMFWWAASFLRAANDQDMSHFPQAEYFVPRQAAEA